MKRLFIVYLFFLVLCNSCSSLSPPLDNDIKTILLKPGLKVLDIGNSFTTDATVCLPYIIEKLGADVSDMCLYKVTRGSASFKRWCEIYNDKDNSSYEIKKIVGGLNIGINEITAEAYDGRYFRFLLQEVQWDIIIIHQLGRYSTAYDEWKGDSEAGYLDELIAIIKDNQPSSIIGYLFTHSSSSDYPTNVEHSSFKRWENSSNAILRLTKEYDIIYIIPYGTAIQNLRSSSLNDDNDLTRDGAHLGHGLAQYTAACCYYEALIAPRTGVSIMGKNIPFTVKDDPTTSQYSVSSHNIGIAQKSAILACKYPFLCIIPE